MKIYKQGEEVTFTIGSETFTGTVIDSHVSIKNGSNNVVFNRLGINYDVRIAFCSKHYGYKACDGRWPTCKSGDYQALSRLIHALQELCDKHNGWTLSPKPIKEIKVRDWVKCICNTKAYSTDYVVGEKYQITVKHEYQEDYFKIRVSDSNDGWWHTIPGKCFIPCESDVESIEQVKVGDYVECISHSDQWSEKFVIGKSYEVLKVTSCDNLYLKINSDNCWYVSKKDFILCNPYEPQDNSEWKDGDQYEDFDKNKINIGDKLIYIRSGVQEVMVLKDCTVGKIYTVDLIDSDGDAKIHDDKGDSIGIWGNKKKYFKKIINNQTTINYVKDNSNNSIELSEPFATISAREIARGSAIHCAEIQICI